MRRAAYTNNPFIEVQRVVDDIAAFWGMAGAVIENEDVRRTIADGREMEKKLQK